MSGRGGECEGGGSQVWVLGHEDSITTVHVYVHTLVLVLQCIYVRSCTSAFATVHMCMCVNLLSIGIAGCRGLTWQSLAAICQHCKALTSIDV